MKEHLEHILNFIFIVALLFSIWTTYTALHDNFEILSFVYAIIMIFGGINFIDTIISMYKEDLNNMYHNYLEIIKKNKGKK